MTRTTGHEDLHTPAVATAEGGVARRPRARLVYGCMGLGTPGGGSAVDPAEIDRTWEALQAAVSIGITDIDTADIYRSGGSERVIGEVLRRDESLRSVVHLQTKCGVLLPDAAGTVGHYDLSRAHIRGAIEAALERLQVERIDTLLLHRPDPLADPDEVASALADALEEGLISRWGVSNMGPWQIEHLATAPGRPAVDQLELSLHARGFVESAMNAADPGRPGSRYPAGTVEYCADHGIEVQAWSPLARGRYTGAPAPAGRSSSPEEVRTAALVGELAEAHATTPETIVLWWLTAHPAGVRPVIGTTNPDRIRACADANTSPSGLSRVEWYALLTAARGHDVP